MPFQMLYVDGVERLAAESLLERQKMGESDYVCILFYFIQF